MNNIGISSVFQRKILLLTALFFLGISISFAQSTILSGGGAGSGAGGGVSYSVGQIDYVALVGTNGSAGQGVQQAFELFPVSIENPSATDLAIIIFPNPAAHTVSIKTDFDGQQEVSWQLWDTSGKAILSGTIEVNETDISLQHLSSGTYYFVIYHNQQLVQKYKIIKT